MKQLTRLYVNNDVRNIEHDENNNTIIISSIFEQDKPEFIIDSITAVNAILDLYNSDDYDPNCYADVVEMWDLVNSIYTETQYQKALYN